MSEARGRFKPFTSDKSAAIFVISLPLRDDSVPMECCLGLLFGIYELLSTGPIPPPGIDHIWALPTPTGTFPNKCEHISEKFILQFIIKPGSPTYKPSDHREGLARFFRSRYHISNVQPPFILIPKRHRQQVNKTSMTRSWGYVSWEHPAVLLITKPGKRPFELIKNTAATLLPPTGGSPAAAALPPARCEDLHDQKFEWGLSTQRLGMARCNVKLSLLGYEEPSSIFQHQNNHFLANRIIKSLGTPHGFVYEAWSAPKRLATILCE